MASKDEYYENGETLSMKQAENGVVVHDYQVPRLLPDMNNIFMRYYNFPNADWNKNNIITIPSTDIFVKHAYVEFNVSEITTGSTITWMPTSTWLTAYDGVKLLYRNKIIYQMSEPEALMSDYLDYPTDRFVNLSKNLSANMPPSGSENADVPRRLYLSLNKLADQVLKHIGSISAFNSQDWAIQVSLRPVRSCFFSSSNIASPVVSMNSMKLLLIGLKATGAQVRMQRAVLEKNGLEFYNLRSHFVRTSLPVVSAGNSDSTTTVFSTITGNVSNIRYMHRDTAGLTASATDDVNNVDFDAGGGFASPDNTIEVGKLSKPFDVFGQPIYPPLIRGVLQKVAGNSRLAQANQTNVASVETARLLNSSISDISLSESYESMRNGCSAGSYPIANNLRIKYSLNNVVASTTAQTLDYVIYTHQKVLITDKLFSIVNSA